MDRIPTQLPQFLTIEVHVPLLWSLRDWNLQGALTFQGLCQHLPPLSSPCQSQCEISPFTTFLSYTQTYTSLSQIISWICPTRNTWKLLEWVMSGGAQSSISLPICSLSHFPLCLLLFPFTLETKRKICHLCSGTIYYPWSFTTDPKKFIKYLPNKYKAPLKVK